MGRVLIVDDDQENVSLLQQYLANEGHTFQGANDAESTLHRVRAWKPNLVLLDVNLPGMSGLELIPKLRSSAAAANEYVPILLVSGALSAEDVVKGLNAGADDYLTKPFRAQELISRVRTMMRFKEVQDQLRRVIHRVEELSTTDPVTGLLNLMTFYRRGEDEISKTRRFRKPTALIVMDLDGFASVNESGGFQFGNHILRETAGRIQGCIRSVDLAGRLGGDEFLVLLTETDLSAAEGMAERIRQAIRSQPFKMDKQTAQVTPSIGVAGISYEQGEQKMGDLLRAAQEALRSAKKNGRDQIEIYSFA